MSLLAPTELLSFCWRLKVLEFNKVLPTAKCQSVKVSKCGVFTKAHVFSIQLAKTDDSWISLLWKETNHHFLVSLFVFFHSFHYIHWMKIVWTIDLASFNREIGNVANAWIWWIFSLIMDFKNNFHSFVLVLLIAKILMCFRIVFQTIFIHQNPRTVSLMRSNTSDSEDLEDEKRGNNHGAIDHHFGAGTQ